MHDWTVQTAPCLYFGDASHGECVALSLSVMHFDEKSVVLR